MESITPPKTTSLDDAFAALSYKDVTLVNDGVLFPSTPRSSSREHSPGSTGGEQKQGTPKTASSDHAKDASETASATSLSTATEFEVPDAPRQWDVCPFFFTMLTPPRKSNKVMGGQIPTDSEPKLAPQKM